MSLLKLHPLFYWVAGLLILALGGYLYFKDTETNAARAEALAHAPPTLVAAEDFDPARDSNGAREAAVRGEIDLHAASVVALKVEGAEVSDHRWVAPLRSAARGEDRSIITRAVVEKDGKAFLAELGGLTEADGRSGPIADIRGVWVRPGPGAYQQIAAAFTARGLTLSKDALFFDPFLRSREAELAPKDPALAAWVICGFGALVFLYGLIWSLLRPSDGPGSNGAPREQGQTA